MNRFAVAGSLKLSMYLKDKVKPEIFKKYSHILTEEASVEKVNQVEAEEMFSGTDFSDLRCRRIIEICNGNQIALTAIELACLRFNEPLVSELFELLALDCGDGITLEAATKIGGFEGGLGANIPGILDAFDKISLIMSCRYETPDIARMVLKCDFRLASYLSGRDIPDMDIFDYVDMYVPDEKPVVYGYTQQLEDFKKSISSLYDNYTKNQNYYDDVTIIFSGITESGRTQCAKSLCYDLSLGLYMIDYEFLEKHNDPKHMLMKVLRECLFLDSALCVRGVTQSSNTKTLLKEIRKFSSMFGSRPLFFTVAPDIKPVPYLDGIILNFDIPQLSVTELTDVWQGMIKDEGIKSQLNVSELAGKMRLSVGQIRRTVLLIKTMENSGKMCSKNEVYSICYKVLDDGRYENIKRVSSGFTLDDLKISESNLRILKDLCAQVNYRRLVFDDWNMNKKFAYGKCVSLLLAGAPGTGKTMAIYALSNELGLELYKVDLSQISDKYVGETEKRLEEVFDKAQKSNMILFFDEADSIMGKRSETKDSHDKFANNQIAFILQRIEEYDGIVVLATNYLQNIDSAFMRRIRYVINFDIPDEKTRKEIWVSSFAKEVPLDEDIDWDFLAEHFKLAGGNIKNIVLNATFMAASEEKNVGMQHIIKAIHRENSKDKRISFANDYGKYSYLIPRL